MIIEYSISDEGIIETREMLRAEKQGHNIYFDLICFAKVEIKSDVHSKYFSHFDSVPFFRFMEDLSLFLKDNRGNIYAKSTLCCIGQFYFFKIEKEYQTLLFSDFVGWEKWKPAKVCLDVYKK